MFTVRPLTRCAVAVGEGPLEITEGPGELDADGELEHSPPRRSRAEEWRALQRTWCDSQVQGQQPNCKNRIAFMWA